MPGVRPKKRLGQHFLTDDGVALQIVESISFHNGYSHLLEIGPGTGVLTRHLFDLETDLKLVEFDREAVGYLEKELPETRDLIINADILDVDLGKIFPGSFGVIGNLPYNISSPILFRIFDFRDLIEEVVCMLQYEVAKRIASGPSSKDYGILSVLLQAYYDIEFLFPVEPENFKPPPKVRSGVIRLRRNETGSLECDEQLFRRVVKQAFQNRRKTLRNALKPINLPPVLHGLEILNNRAEQLSVQEFIDLTLKIQSSWSN